MELHHDRLHSCHALVQAKAWRFLEMASASGGHTLLVVRAWSGWAEQMAIYQVGRTVNATTGVWEETGAVRTKAKPGTSAHNVMVMTVAPVPAALAFDIIPLDRAGRPLWQVVDETAEQNEVRWRMTYGRGAQLVWNELYKLMAQCGLDAYGDTWGAFLAWDKGHCEEPAWKLALEPLGLTLPTLEVGKGV